MAQETKVIAALLQDREAYDAIAKYHEDRDFSDMAEIVFKQIVTYYDADVDATTVDLDSLLLRLKRSFPKQYNKFEKFVTGLPEVSAINIVADYRAVKMDSLGERIGSYLMAGEHNKADELLPTYNTLCEEGLTDAELDGMTTEVYHNTKVEEFSSNFEQGNRIALVPAALNKIFNGGLIPGSHVLFYATPNMGKTATAITQAFGAAYKHHKVLYCGNEDPAPSYLMRLKSRFTNLTEEQILKDPDAADVLADSRGWNNLIFAHMPSGTLHDLHALALEHEVEVVILDQLHNMKAGDGKGKPVEGTQLLTLLAYQHRMFLSKHGIVGISFTQADDKAIGKLFLDIKNVYYSNIGVQGQTDVMIGVGCDQEHESMGRRVFNVTKNKITGIHGHVMVQLVNKLSAIKGIGV